MCYLLIGPLYKHDINSDHDSAGASIYGLSTTFSRDQRSRDFAIVRTNLRDRNRAFVWLFLVREGLPCDRALPLNSTVNAYGDICRLSLYNRLTAPVSIYPWDLFKPVLFSCNPPRVLITFISATSIPFCIRRTHVRV